VSYSAALPSLPCNLTRDQVWLLAQDFRTSKSEPIPALMLAAQRRLYQLDVEQPRTERRLRAIRRQMEAHPEPPRLTIWVA
jgi:hypothetical protein